jgi:hypothetical protein
MTSQTMKLLIIIVCMILLWFGIQGIRTGRVKEEGNEIIYRDKSPAQYRLTVGIYIGLGIAGILYALFLSIQSQTLMFPSRIIFVGLKISSLNLA